MLDLFSVDMTYYHILTYKKKLDPIWGWKTNSNFKNTPKGGS